MEKWWASGNTLALVDAIQRHAREADGGWRGVNHESMNSHLIGAARQIGLSEDEIRDAFESDRQLVVYEP